MKQLNVGLPDDMRANLEKVAKANGRGLAEEIRHRLAISIAFDSLDRASSNFCMDVMWALYFLQIDTEAPGRSWTEHPRSFECLRLVIERLLNSNRPPTNVVKPERDDEDDPKTLARVIFRQVQREKREISLAQIRDVLESDVQKSKARTEVPKIGRKK